MKVSSTAKVMAPQVPSFAVLRSGLVRMLDDATNGRVTLVVAPPGYGKSVLLAQWTASRSDRRVAWLHLDPSDNNATEFAAGLVHSLQTLYPDVGATSSERIQTTGEALGD